MTPVAKPPIDPVRWRPESSRMLPAADLDPQLHAVLVPGPAPEDVVVDADGTVWTGLADGKIVRIDADTHSPTVVANTNGVPLGLAMARDGRLLICDSHRGLLRMDTASGEFETLVAEVDEPAEGNSARSVRRPLRFCSNVVESSDGTIYFTESTSRFHFEHYKGAIIEGRGAGALFRRDIDGTVTTLVSGLYFANGVTLTADEDALVFAESQAARLSKYWLDGPAAGTVTRLADELPGYPDNISTGADGRIWVAMASSRNALIERLVSTAPVVRKVLWRLLPYCLLPDVKPLVWVIALDPEDGRVLSQVRTAHPPFGATTGVVQHGNRIWLAGINGSAVAWFDL